MQGTKIYMHGATHTHGTNLSKGVTVEQTPDPIYAATSHKQTGTATEKSVQRAATSTTSTLTVPYGVGIYVAGASMRVAGFSNL